MEIEIINPTTEEIIAAYPFMKDNEVNAIVNKAVDTSKIWRKTPLKERKEKLQKLMTLLNSEATRYANLMTAEMGKPIKEGIAEVKKCALCCAYYADHAATFLKDTELKSEVTSYTVLQPLGVILAIMPWNYPFWQVIRHAAPTTIAGNVILLKHAPNVTGCAKAIEALFLKAGFPEGVFSALVVDVEATSTLIEDDRVKAVTLTGSNAAGKAVAARAGNSVKKVVLELGGSDPYIVLKDADIDKAVTACTISRLQNAGQSCIAAKRFIVDATIETEFKTKLLNNMKEYTFGNPVDANVDLGPMARKDLREALHRQVTESIQLGADCILGGVIPKGKGYFYPPTILTNVKKGMPAFDEELFGPVAVIISAKDEKEAINKANDSEFGLGAAIFTSDIKNAQRIAREELEVGMCTINNYNQSAPSHPFGGTKKSGYGRELHAYGIKEFMNVKTITVS